ncbi:non-ribosomal peptide synthetase [Acetonema longum]|uniref:Amino acid adenylation domain-containing protein n=1 Tax=Acetonema longum DSM 6540 TaxID=1009370 RepID=F7NDS9_9FIRM|nr:non-ribosomal peptide synthetase [Acetonema longum]EGO65800.1 amino acid adenylation domain-containing protein [Acetonema longum DSM 6540]
MLLDKHSRNVILSCGDFTEEKEYWTNKLGDEIHTDGFPANRYPDHRQYAPATVKCIMPGEISDKIVHLGNGSEQAIYMILLSGIKYLLHRYTGSNDLFVGMPVFQQEGEGGEAEYFNAVLPLRSGFDREQTFGEWLLSIKNVILEADRYQNYPLDKIYEQLALCAADSGNSLFQTVVLLENIHEKKLIDPQEIATMFSFLLTGRVIAVTVEYNANLYTQQMMEQVVSHLFHYFQAVTGNPRVKLAEIDILAAGERSRILGEFNRTAAAYPQDQTIQQLFEEQVHQTPDNTAVVFENQRLTYRELNEKADRLAGLLRNKGVTANSVVGIMTERSLEMIIAIMGILKAGGAYLPIDPTYAADRITYMLEDSRAKLLLTQKPFLAKLALPIEKIDLADGIPDGEAAFHPEAVSQAGDLAYVIYTSGTTGQPKGVMIEHRNVVNLAWGLRDAVYRKYGAALNVALLSPYVFDASVKQIFPALLFGHALCIVPESLRYDRAGLLDFYRKNSIDLSDGTPAHIRILNSDSPGETELRVKEFLIGGEALPGGLAREFLQRFGSGRMAMTNVYGPTECCDVAAVQPVNEHETGAFPVIPVGKPLANVQVYILGKDLAVLPVHAVGELYIGGRGVGRGYLNRPELTAEKFVDNPFLAGERMYRTGDLARWLPDSAIEFLGRIDHQVKIRGFRIELGEIEAQLLKHAAVKEAAVLAREDGDGVKYLCAYIVAGQAATVAELRSYLAGTLPDYMIPAYFGQLDKLPLTANGKLDRKALPEPDGSVGSGVEYKSAANETEEILVKVWQEVLKTERVGVGDNFFSLGGDSIKGIQVLSRLKHYGLSLEMRDLFSYPVIEELSGHVKTAIRQVDQGIVEGPVGLTPIQCKLFEQSFSDKHHYNQAVMLYHQDGFDAAAVGKVLAKLTEHHDALRLVVSEEKGRTGLFNRGLTGDLYSLEVADLRCHEHYREIIAQKADEIQAGIDLCHGPLVKAGLFQTKDGDHLLLVIHHLAVDGVSWRIILQDFADGYTQALRHEAIQLPDKTNSFREWSEKLAAYANSPQLLSEAEYWAELEAAEVKPLPKDRRIAQRSGKDSGQVVMELTEAETETLLKQVNIAYNTEINDILLTALGLAISQWAGDGLVLIHLEGHGREGIIKDIDISRTVGWFTAQYPVMLDMRGDRDLAYRIKSVKESLRQIPHKGIGYGILKYLTSPGHKAALHFSLAPEISFNYLGQFDAEAADGGFGLSELSAGKSVSDQLESPHAIDINGMVARGRLQLTLIYNKQEYRQETMLAVAEKLRQNLTDVIDHCAEADFTELTPSDFTLKGISIEGLEDLEEQFSDID